MKKVLAILVALMIMASALPMMASAEGEAQTLKVMLGGGTPLSIDPHLNSASGGGNILKCAFTGLLSYQPPVDGAESVLGPDLAESMPTISEDLLTYTFTLREGLKWSDGEDFVASQMVSSWERSASEELGADYGFLFDVIARNAEGKLDLAADDAARTFTVKLKAYTPYFLDLCAFYPFVPIRVELADNEGIWATKPESYVGMGPFKMTKYAVDDEISFVKNDNYWNKDAIKLDGINFYLSEDNVAVLTAYENNTVQFIDTIDPTEYERIKTSYPGELNFSRQVGTWYILINAYKDVSPAGKQLTVQEQSKARQAVGMLINRQEIVEYVTQGEETAATGFYPVISDGMNENVRASDLYGKWYQGTATPAAENANLTQDQVDACKILIDLGYAYTGTVEGGDVVFTDFPSIDFAFNNSAANKLIIEYVQETWNRFGIPATINTEAWSTLQQKLKAGDAEAARMGWLADFNDCINFLEIFISNSGNNYPRLGKELGDYQKASDVTKDAGMGAYWGPEGNQTWAECFDALVDQIKVAPDPQTRAELCAKGEQILMDTGCVAPIYFYTRPYMQKPEVKDVMVLPIGGIIFTYASIG